MRVVYTKGTNEIVINNAKVGFMIPCLIVKNDKRGGLQSSAITKVDIKPNTTGQCIFYGSVKPDGTCSTFTVISESESEMKSLLTLTGIVIKYLDNKEYFK